jgi:DNA polymerase-3 subunit epsilon
MNDDTILRFRNDASQWARDVLARDPSVWVILDTETTGLDGRAQVVQISIIDGAGAPLMKNVLIKPTVEIEREAADIHGITSEMVSDAPAFGSIAPEISELLKDKLVLIYNAPFDVRILKQSAQAVDYDDGLTILTQDVMQKYAEWVGEWNHMRGSFKWQKLPGGDHTSLGDCIAVLDVIKRMAGQVNPND